MTRTFNFTFGDWTRSELQEILSQDFEGSEEAVGALMLWTDKQIDEAFERASEKMMSFLHDGPALLDYFLEAMNDLIPVWEEVREAERNPA